MSSELNNKMRLERMAFQDKAIACGIWQSCLNCSNFEPDSEVCKLFKQRPPAYIVVSGCKDHIGDIPF